MANDDLKLEDILDETWLPALGPVIRKTPLLAKEFLGPDRAESIVPMRELTFRAVVRHAPQQWNVVIFGQCPFASRVGANGIACCDARVSAWTAPLSPTLRNVIKGACIHGGLMQKTDKVETMRAALREEGVLKPTDWFLSTIDQGVLWLNASLTADTEQKNAAAHQKFWKPIVEEIIATILRTKKDEDANGCVFVLWGNQAQKLEKMITTTAGRLGVGSSIRFVKTANPAVEQFHDSNSFDLINQHLESLGKPLVDWLATSLETVNSGDVVQDGSAMRRQVIVKKRGRDGGEESPAKKKKCEPADNDDTACKVCMVNKIDCVLLNCGHVAICMDCAEKLKDCPFCRQKIRKVVKAYFPG